MKESSVDAILVGDVVHGLTHPDAMLAGFHRALRPGGRLAVLGQTSRLGEHIPQENVISQAAAAGLRLISFDADFSGPPDDRAYFALFEKPR